MSPETVENLMACYRSGARTESKIDKAVREAGKSDELRPKLETQEAFDSRIVEVIHFIKPPENLRQRLEDLRESMPAVRDGKLTLRNPAILCAIFGVLFIVGFLFWQQMEHGDDFPGRDAVEQMVDATREMSGVELEPTTLPASQLGDPFYMAGFEGFAAPPQFAQEHAVGMRVFKHPQNGHPIAQFAIDRHEALLMVFHTGDFGITLPADKTWKIFTQEDWVAAVQSQGELCTLIAFRGGRSDMESFIATLK